jgi:hypothetical protein
MGIAMSRLPSKETANERPLVVLGAMGLPNRQQRWVRDLRRSLEVPLRRKFGTDGVPREWVEKVRTACYALGRELRNNARLEQYRKGKAKLTVEQQMECERVAERASKERQSAVHEIAKATAKPDAGLSDYLLALNQLASVPPARQQTNGTNAELRAVEIPQTARSEARGPTGQAVKKDFKAPVVEKIVEPKVESVAV